MRPIPNVVAAAEIQTAPAHAESPYSEAAIAETGLLEELIRLLRSQRQAVADDDLQLLDDLTAAIHRRLHQVAEARGSREDRGADQHDVDELRAVGCILAREVKRNQQILREALGRSDEYARAICGAIDPAARGLSERTVGASLINRTV